MECRILFHDKAFAQLDWCKLEAESGRILGSGSASINELVAIIQGASSVVVLLNQQDILLTSPSLPPRANKQQLNAIAYAVEEQLAEDVEDCFFATAAQQEDDSVPVAVINRSLMDELTQILAQQHVTVRYVLPSVYLCPWAAEEEGLTSICPVNGGYLVRSGEHEGLFCAEDLLEPVIALLQQQAGDHPLKIRLYGAVNISTSGADPVLIEQYEAINLLAQPLNLHTTINLKQKEYQSHRQWLGLARRWQWPMVAMLLLGLVIIASQVIESSQQQQRYDKLIVEQRNLLENYLPIEVTDAPPKKQLLDYLAANQGQAGQGGFMDLLHEYVRLKSGFSAIDTDRIQFQNAQLVVNLESRELKSLESLRAKLTDSTYVAQIENVNIGPEKTTGRLVMAVQ